LQKRIWQLSLFSFLVAAFTGFLYRYGLFYPLPGDLGFANIRHAHSHLMFFNWITPPLLSWMVAALGDGENEKTPAGFKPCLYTMIGLGFLSYPLFLLFGYHAVPVASLRLPLAAIISGLVMITWYWFAVLWYVNRRQSSNRPALVFFDAALVTLLISSLGAWGVSVFQFTDIDNPLFATSMTHFFLGVFTEGWVTLGVLGLIWDRAEVPASELRSGWLWNPILFGSMLVFPFSLNRALLTPSMLIAAYAGLILISISLILNLRLMYRHNIFHTFLLKTTGLLLTIKAAALIIAVMPVDIWPGEQGVRILYLHIHLLGIASLTLIDRFHPLQDRLAKIVFSLCVLSVLLTLAMISGYWPAWLMPPGVYTWVTVAALLPLLPGIWLWFRTFSIQPSNFKKEKSPSL